MFSKYSYYTKILGKYAHSLKFAIETILKNCDDEKDIEKKVFYSLLNRIGSNITSIYHLSKCNQKENLDSSICLLFRSCFSDIVLGYYLFTFQKNKLTFENEVKILDLDFLDYAIKTSKIEQKLLSRNEEESCKRNKEINEVIKMHYNELLAPSVDLKPKTAKQIREEFKSDKNLFDQELFVKNRITETDMFRHLFEIEKEKFYFENIFILWKFYSQFQHYSFEGEALIKMYDEKAYLSHFLHSLICCYDFVNVLAKFVLFIPAEKIESTKLKLVRSYEESKIHLN